MQVVSVSSNLTRAAAQQCGHITQVNIHCGCVLANVTTLNINPSMSKARAYDRSPAFYKISHEDGSRESFLEIVMYFLTSAVAIGS